MRTTFRAWAIGIAWALFVSGASAHDRITTKVTWAREIAPIVLSRCTPCHVPEGRGTMSLATYEDARPWAKAIKEEVLERRMPKWHAVRGYGDFANDPSLSPFEIALFVAWADGGAPKGEAVHREGATLTAGVSGLSRKAACVGPVPSGTLLSVQPHLSEGSTAGFAIAFPDGRRSALVFVKNFEPRFTETYVLRRPLTIPAGARLETMTDSDCEIELTYRKVPTRRAGRTAR